ncbi:ABC transporter ATP-binding protein [Bacillus sp. H-16]|uniref:ABC transporter ATP-binding protein n=1 Tax=Alteribacter salitolerans TaxID=2912333 RepID=UPI001962C04B|nr:ABC transporter ATP-binding protein [Alteribacter salitolerans]MBM7096500.1 ABC transporter ATP-binding protein [Alteribacter salitolerans]
MDFLHIQQLKKTYEQQTVFENVTLSLQKGELLSLIGPSGTGKSTFLRCLAGLEGITKGEIKIDGKDMSNVRAEARPVVLMFQQPLLFPHMTVLENVTYGLRIRGVKKKERNEAGLAVLEKVELKDYGNHYPSECSGGQQQRIALARALVIKPQLLLLDEPFSSLDTKLRINLRSWIRSLLKKENMTAVFVTHDRDEASFMGDKLAVMGNKTILQTGSPKEVQERPESSGVTGVTGEGLALEGGFVPAKNLRLERGNPTGQNGENGTVERVWTLHGVVFYRVQLERTSVTVHSKRDLTVGEKIAVTWDEDSFVEYQREKGDNHA